MVGVRLVRIVVVAAWVVCAPSRWAVMTTISTCMTLAMTAYTLVARSCVTAIVTTRRSGDSDLLDLVLPLAGLLLSSIAVTLRGSIRCWNLSEVKDIIQDRWVPIATSIFRRVNSQTSWVLDSRLCLPWLLLQHCKAFLVVLLHVIASPRLINIIVLHLDLIEEIIRSGVQSIVLWATNPNCTSQ